LGFAPEAVRVALKDFSAPEKSGSLRAEDLEGIIKKSLTRLAP
jgi:hypothetical protein